MKFGILVAGSSVKGNLPKGYEFIQVILRLNVTLLLRLQLHFDHW